MNQNKLQKSVWTAVVVIIAVAGVIICTQLNKVMAEKSGSSPESGVSSRIKTLYDDLSTLTYGADTDSPDWGTLWNRIKTAAKWTPSGNADVTDVKTGKTFYSTTRGQQTGTYPNPTSCSTQQNADNTGNITDNCSLNWPAADPSVVGDDQGVATFYSGKHNQDPRTGLVWSQYLKNNNGTVEFAASGGSNWSWDGTLTFTISSSSVTQGSTYTNNGQTFTVYATTSSSTSLKVTGTGVPSASGTLTKATGPSGDPATINFSAVANTTNNVAVGNKSAMDLCSSQGNGWRLPSEKELLQAYVDGAYFNLTNTASGNIPFWSSTTGTPAYYVYLNNGSSGSNSGSPYYVRCVREQ